MTRLRKCAVCRRVAPISAHPSSSETRKPAAPRIVWSVIRLSTLRSSAVAIERAAFSETFEVSAERMRSRENGIALVQPLVRAQVKACDRPPGEERGSGCAEVTYQLALLDELRPDALALGSGEEGLVVVAVDRGCGPALEQRAGAAIQESSDVGGVGLRSRSDEQDLSDVALRERALPGGHLEHRGLVLRARGRPDREGHADRREERKGGEDRGDRLSPPRGERLEGGPGASHHDATSCADMPPR